MAMETTEYIATRREGFRLRALRRPRHQIPAAAAAAAHHRFIFASWDLGVLVLVILRRIRVEKLNGRHRLLYDDVPWY